MGAYLPGPAGFAVFAAVKFGGYLLAGMTLRKLQPAITAGVMKIAAKVWAAHHFSWPNYDLLID